MKVSNLAALEQLIDDWVQQIAEKEQNEYDGYYCPELVALMAQAAAAVFDAQFLGQRFADAERE